MSSTKQTNNNEPRISPLTRPPKRILQTIYGSRFIRNSKQLTPLLNTSAHNIKNIGTNDYYTFQKGLATGGNAVVKKGSHHNGSNNNSNNPEMRKVQNYRKAFTVAKPNSTYKQSLTMTTSRTKLINFVPVSQQNTNNNYNSNNNNNPSTNVNVNTNNSNNKTTNNISAVCTPKSTPKSTHIIISMNNNSNINTANNNNNKDRDRGYGYSSGKKMQIMMNNTSTGFTNNRSPTHNTRNPLLNPQNFHSTNTSNTPKIHQFPTPTPKKNTNIMNNTSYSFRPTTTNAHFRQCNNNQAQNLNNYLSKYQIIKELGKGTYGVVHLAKKKKQKQIYIKQGIYENNNNNNDNDKYKDDDGDLDISHFQDQKCQGNQKNNDSFMVAYGNIRKHQQQKYQMKNQSFSIQYQHQKQKQFINSFQITKETNEKAQNQCCQSQQLVLTKQNIILPVKQQQKQETELTLSKKQQKQQNQQKKQQQQQQLFAIKIYQKFKMNKDPTKFKNIRKQINIMQNINHENIIILYQSVQTLTKISLVVQYGGHQSLLDYLKQNFPLQDKIMRKIGIQLLDAIKYLHQKNIVHRDIKLQNILMGREGKIKIIDFGFSTLTFRNRKLNAICGTPNYMAPEVLSKKQYIGQYADIWSFGVVMFTLAEGRHPFKAQTYNELQRLANKGNFTFKRINNTVHQAFIKRVLRVKPEDRPRAADLMSHPWLAMKDQQQNKNESNKLA